ncbi:biotin/lipoyl-binding protein [Dyella choica]|uniref:HlyD family secretion protein n=1 Tax=Dyella choica TaxID=1927959 RepID=A0A3S0WY96_9GAMM|nr:HlyD family secretion protein [Dyella choica]RUL78985.1 HlyD family secretion protein [Dyella choica]
MTAHPLLRVAATLATLLIAITLGHYLWRDYMESPWTRDGRVKANVIKVASDVSGLVTQVLVADNQHVHKGDTLFVIDPVRFRDALLQAQAQVARTQAQIEQAKAQLEQRQSEWNMRKEQALRRQGLGGDVITNEARTDYNEQAHQALAAYHAAQATLQAANADNQAAVAALQTAQLNLERSLVRAPADGFITNLNLYPGDYTSAGAARIAMIDEHSFWVYGYFEETKLPGVRIGDRAQIEMMAGHLSLQGHVESIASGITDRDNPDGANLLADVNPIFTWVRLAQRVPVRIALDGVPEGLHLAAGMTCTVILHPASKHSS